jgi:hypothetical protein
LRTNRLATLLDSYRLATRQPPPPGHVLVHNQIDAAREHEGSPRFRVWWARPASEFILCACGWRPDLGNHYRIHRPGPLVRRAARRGVRPAS